MRGPVILATRSAGKVRELRALFGDARIAVLDLDEAGLARSADEDAVECHDTFEANAIAKARYYAARANGRPVVADDSGLEVLALGGEPGVHSKRWSGRGDLSGAALDTENNRLLLQRLAGVEDRRARFVCVAAWCGPDGSVELARGAVDGHIIDQARGSGGFGYDPLFYANELGSTLGESSVAEKQRVSHRGRAFRALAGAVSRRAGPSGGGG